MASGITTSSKDHRASPADATAADPRLAAFCSSLHPGLFHAVAYGSDIWRPDVFDVTTIHEQARTALERTVGQVRQTSGIPIGRIHLLLGDSGSGKTHLMRAFRNRVHAEHQGYCGYLQMTSFTDEYSRYVLNNLIESLDRPYYKPESECTGLTRLSNSLVAAIGCPGDVLESIREGECDQETLDRFVDEMADRFISDSRFQSIDVYLVQALLYLQGDDPRIKARVLKYLRCEDLTSQDRLLLGGIVPCVHADAADRVLQRLGELMWILEQVPLVLCVDQLEDMFDMHDAPARFRRSLATLGALTSKLPSAIVVISCLSDYYSQVKACLTRSTTDRIEGERGPITLKEAREANEIVPLISERLKFLYESAGVRAEFREADPTYPIPRDAVAKMAGMRTRDVLNRCQVFRDSCAAEGKLVPFESEDPSGGAPSDESEDTEIEQSWNDFRSRFSPVVPVDEPELAAVLAHTIRACARELGEGWSVETDDDGRFVPVEIHGPGDAVSRILVGVCNKKAQGGGLGKQIEEVMQRAGEHIAVVVRSTTFPSNPKAVVSQLIYRLISGGGRRIVVEDSDWRTMLAFAAFARDHGNDPRFVAWQCNSRPLTSLGVLRTILDSDQPCGRTDGPEDGHTPAIQTSNGVKPAGTIAEAVPVEPRTSPTPFPIGTTKDRRAEPVTLDPAELTRHAVFLGASGSGKTTLALSIVEQLLLQGVPAILIDRKGDLCVYAQDDMGLGSPSDGLLAERSERLRHQVDVALYTPRRPDGRPLAIAAAPAGLGALPAHDRQQAARTAATALAGMMHYGDGKGDLSRLAVLSKAIDLLGQQQDQAPISIEHLIEYIDERDPALLNEVGRLDVKLLDRLVQDLETLRLNQGDLLEARGEPLDIEALLGLGPHTRPGKTRLSIISTKFLGGNQDIQFWVAQLLMEVGRWIDRAPAPDGTLQAVLLFDEADLYLPAVRQPPSKEPMEHLLRRARSAGLGLFLASQSPGDFDYRCRDNIRAWFVGQVKEPNSLNKMKPMLGDARIDIASRLPGQTTGDFHLLREGAITGLRADRSAVETRQLPDDQIVELARRSASVRPGSEA